MSELKIVSIKAAYACSLLIVSLNLLLNPAISSKVQQVEWKQARRLAKRRHIIAVAWFIPALRCKHGNKHFLSLTFFFFKHFRP